jgi:hypothetical protein
MQIDIVQAVALFGAVAQAVQATASQIADVFRANQGDLTDEQLNALIDGVVGDAARRKALADADVEQAIRDGAK